MDIDDEFLVTLASNVAATKEAVETIKTHFVETQVVCNKCLEDHESRLRILAETKADESDLEKVGARVGRLEKVEWTIGGVVAVLGLSRIWQFFGGGS